MFIDFEERFSFNSINQFPDVPDFVKSPKSYPSVKQNQTGKGQSENSYSYDIQHGDNIDKNALSL